MIPEFIEMQVKQRVGYDFYDILPTERRGDKYCFSVPDGNGTWERIEIKMGEDLSPIYDKVLSMPGWWLKSLYKALVKIYGDAEPHATTQELKATKYHLEDMRKLSFREE